MKRRDAGIALNRVNEVCSGRVGEQVGDPLLDRLKVTVLHYGGAVPSPEIEVLLSRKSLHRIGELLLNLSIKALTLVAVSRLDHDMGMIPHERKIDERDFMVSLHACNYSFDYLLHVRRRSKG